LESNFNNLKDTLQQLGLVVDELSVSVGDNGAEARQHFEQNKQKSSRRIEQIIENVNGLEESLDEDYVNPYELKDNQVDYMA
jgi:flagellar hook-length control protein FliK